jgi:hypothetical protein
VLLEDLAESHAVRVGDTEEEEVEGVGSNTDGAHAVVDTAGAETSLEHLEATAKVARATGNGLLKVEDDVLVDDLAVALGGVVVAKDLHGADNLDTGGLGVDEEDRVALVPGRVSGVSLGDDNVDGATGVTGTRDPPLVAVEDELVALPAGNSVAEVGSVGRGNWRPSDTHSGQEVVLVLTSVLGHREGGADLAVDKGHEVLVLLGLGAETSKDLHVSSVGSGAVHGLGHEVATVARELGNDGVLEVGETGTGALGKVLELTAREPEVPEADLLGLGLEGLEDGGDDLPALGTGLGELLVVERNGGHAVVLEERDGSGEDLLALGREVGLNLRGLLVQLYANMEWRVVVVRRRTMAQAAAPMYLVILGSKDIVIDEWIGGGESV